MSDENKTKKKRIAEEGKPLPVRKSERYDKNVKKAVKD